MPITKTRRLQNWACVYCDHVSRTSREARRHRAGHTPEELVLTCEICGRVFSSGYGSAYRCHMIAHSQAEANFWRQVIQDDETGCWEWQASKIDKGYPRFTVCRVHILAYRYAYELLEGPVPEGLELDHLCRNPSCVNPGHLEPVTHLENTRRGHRDTKQPCPHCDRSMGRANLARHIKFKHPEGVLV